MIIIMIFYVTELMKIVFSGTFHISEVEILGRIQITFMGGALGFSGMQIQKKLILQ